MDLGELGLESVLDGEDGLDDEGADDAELEVQEDHQTKTDHGLLLSLGVLLEVVGHVRGGDELGLLAGHGLGLIHVLEHGGVLLALDTALNDVGDGQNEELCADVASEDDLLGLCVLKVQTVGDLH